MDTQELTETAPALPRRTSRRAAIGQLLGGLALLAGVEAAAKPKARGKVKATAKRKRKPKPKPKFKMISRTFTNASPITIPFLGPANPYPSEIRVAGFKQGKLHDVNVVLSGFGHSIPSDVDVMLESPNARRAVIMSDVGDAFSVSNLTLTLDDQAAASLPIGSQLGSGSFRPTNDGGIDSFPPPGAPSSDVALATFKGINPNGTWKLYVVDDLGGFNGSFAGGWSLTIKARVRNK